MAAVDSLKSNKQKQYEELMNSCLSKWTDDWQLEFLMKIEGYNGIHIYEGLIAAARELDRNLIDDLNILIYGHLLRHDLYIKSNTKYLDETELLLTKYCKAKAIESRNIKLSLLQISHTYPLLTIRLLELKPEVELIVPVEDMLKLGYMFFTRLFASSAFICVLPLSGCWGNVLKMILHYLVLEKKKEGGYYLTDKYDNDYMKQIVTQTIPLHKSLMISKNLRRVTMNNLHADALTSDVALDVSPIFDATFPDYKNIHKRFGLELY